MLKKMFFVITIVVLVLTACGPVTQETDQGISVEKKFDEGLYLLTLQLENDPDNYSQLQGSLSGIMASGFGSISGSLWQDGKGLVRGKIADLEPTVDFASIGDLQIIKTTDFKVMALKPGDTAFFICTIDYEPVCSLKDEKGFTSVSECQELWEFDYCRLKKVIPSTD